jgi:lipoprotein-anchoring transpeptidase ErfK/SrfK
LVLAQILQFTDAAFDILLCGFAIHGSYEISHLGRPASHGCVRLDPGNAAILFGLVQREGMAATTIVIH